MTNTTISDIVRYADKTARERNVKWMDTTILLKSSSGRPVKPIAFSNMADWDIRKTTQTIWRDSTESW